NLFDKALEQFTHFLSRKEATQTSDLYVDALLRAGDCQFILKKYPEALKLYEKASKQPGKPFPDYTAYQLGATYYRLSKYQDAIDYLKIVVEQHKQSPYRDEALNQMGEIYLTWLTDYENASKMSQKLIAEYPKSRFLPNAYNRLGIAAYNSKNEKAAIQYFKTTLMEYGTEGEAVKVALDGINTIVSEAEYDEIYAQYRKKYPNANPALEELTFTTARDRFYADNYESALRQLNEYIKEYPTGKYVYEALALRAELHEKQNRIDEALADWKAIYDSPTESAITPKALSEAADLFMKRKNYTEAILLYQRLDSLADDLTEKVSAQLGLCEALVQTKEFNTAKDLLNKIRQNPAVTEYARNKATVLYGNVLYASGSLKEALELFKSVEADAKNVFGVESQYMIAKILFDQKEYQQSKSAVLYLKDHYPSYNQWKARAFLIIAEDYLALKDTFQAVETLRSLIRNAPLAEVKLAATERLAGLNIPIVAPPKPEPKINEATGKPKPVADDEEEEEEEVPVKPEPKPTVKPKPQTKPIITAQETEKK
ncbi:MAG: tetratricopeptide repeat protein, partial [Bacteroidia bacterium]|nr:tetratricopeptide repeat protein [Bacteroidia bacterium]